VITDESIYYYVESRGHTNSFRVGGQFEALGSMSRSG